MESVLGRYRNLIILVGVLFLQVLGLAVQVKRGSTAGQDTRLIRVWAVGAVSPLERALIWVQNSTGDIWHNYFYLRGVRAENRQLKQQIEQMRLEQVRLSEDAAQAHRLQVLLAFKEQFIAKTVAAQVIGSSGTDSSRVVYIDKGENAGIKRDMAVITTDGIVGKVLLVYPSVSQVLLINDQTSGVGVLLRDSRLQGFLVGAANGEVTLNGVMSDEQVPVGEAVLTSGGDQIFPKGLPVGTVSKVGTGKDLFLNIKIKPAADLSKLEEVLVLVEKQERQAIADDKVRVRAADVLAQRLPSVPDKPATDANANAAATAKPASKPGSPTKPPNSSANTAAATSAATAKTASNPNTTSNPGVGTKPAGTTTTPTSATKSASRPAAGQTAGTATVTGTTENPAKPKTANNAPVTPKTDAIQVEPAIIEQKPVTRPAVPPNSPPPDPNSPQ
jgi:rod shape-determining protein MreC